MRIIKKHITIVKDDCRGCPEFKQYDDRTYCTQKQRRIMWIKHESDFPIPEWCPLSNTD